jgi:hypothetical protein
MPPFQIFRTKNPSFVVVEQRAMKYRLSKLPVVGHNAALVAKWRANSLCAKIDLPVLSKTRVVFDLFQLLFTDFSYLLLLITQIFCNKSHPRGET